MSASSNVARRAVARNPLMGNGEHRLFDEVSFISSANLSPKPELSHEVLLPPFSVATSVVMSKSLPLLC
jgi:hypothetical protein